MRNMLYAVIFLVAVITLSLVGSCRCKENFTGSYADCRSKGFTAEFCVQTPVATQGVGTCLCDDGTIGLQMPGFGGECVCQQALANPLYR